MTTAVADLRNLGVRAMEYVSPGYIVGLGTGRAATAFIEELGRAVRDGLAIRGVPTSKTSEELARKLGIPLTTLDQLDGLDVTVDGADEVDPHCNLIKGYGGAMVREKIVASASRTRVILVGAEKVVPLLGSRGKLPIEVVPFGAAFCRRRLAAIGFKSELRQERGKPFVTDNGNHVIDCRIPSLEEPGRLETLLMMIPGIVGTGLFLGLANTILIQHADRIEVRQPGDGCPADT